MKGDSGPTYSDRNRAALAPREKNFWRAGPPDFVGNKTGPTDVLGNNWRMGWVPPPPARNPQNRIVTAGNNWGSIGWALIEQGKLSEVFLFEVLVFESIFQ